MNYVIIYAGQTIEKNLDYWAIATNFSRRDRQRESTGETFEDLDSWLTHKPWVGPSRENAYLDLVKRGGIEPLIESQVTPVDTKGTTPLQVIGKEWIAKLLMNLWKERPYLLPTQQVELFKEQCRKDGIQMPSLDFHIGKSIFKVSLG